MNERQQQLYSNLLTLASKKEAFYFQDFSLEGAVYRIFNYRLASYTDFLEPDALECRGIMFEVNSAGEAVRLASWPQEKFFNLHENPMTMNMDLTQVESIELKADGSLMSTYVHNGQVRLKSKGSLFSEHAVHATEFLYRPENAELLEGLAMEEALGNTVNLEWCAPQHRIVLGYLEPCLTVLNIRSKADGSYRDPNKVGSHIPSKYWIEKVNVEDPVTFIQSIPDMEKIEGYVVRFKNGQRIKIKTNWYLALHRTKDSVNSPRRLYEAVLSETSDDLRAMFHDDPLVIKQIDEMEKFVVEKYNNLLTSVNNFHQRNKELSRKEFAILGQSELDKHQFTLAMRLYLDQEVNIKQYMLAKWKEFGIKDDPEPSSHNKVCVDTDMQLVPIAAN